MPTTTAIPSEKPEYIPTIPKVDADEQSAGAAEEEEQSSDGVPVPVQTSTPIRTSMLHYLVPASKPNDLFCAVVASALVNRYPVPYVIGWRGEGKYNATAAHFAKLYTIQRYLHDLPNGGEDDDLIIFGDGHDVVAQLPAEVMIERYFEVAADANRRLADRFGISVDELQDRGLKQTLFWGADKMCWPNSKAEARCSKIPDSHLPQNMFGAKSGIRDFEYREAKFLNSGSVIGPIADLRKFIDAGITEMETTFDENYKYKNSDQVYLARIFGRQEVSRTEQITKAAIEDDEVVEPEPEKIESVEGAEGVEYSEELEEEDPAAAGNKLDETEGLRGNREKRADFVKSGKHKSEMVEYHLAIDYESAFVQTGCYNHRWMRMLQYNNEDHSATMDVDVIGHGEFFKPERIQMPANVYKAFRRVFDSLGDDRPSTSAHSWIGNLKLDTNVVTKTIFGFYHATCSKRTLLKDFKTYWFHPLIKPLLKAAARTTKEDETITEKLIDGRKWLYKKSYPAPEEAVAQLGGVFTDFEDEAFIPYKELCGEHLGVLQP